MKTIRLFLFIISFGNCYSQDVTVDNNIYEGILSNLYLSHQPSAKGEMMGRGLVANNDGRYGSYYNPALTSLSKGVNFDYSYSQSGGEKPSFNYYAVSYSGEKLGSFGVSAYYASKTPLEIYENGGYRKKNYYDAVYTVNYSKEVIKDFYAGVNLGVFHFTNLIDFWTNPDYIIIDDGFTFDLGLLKKFNIKSQTNEQIFQIGASLYNITNSKVSHDFGGVVFKDPLPATFRIGASHQLKIANGKHEGVPYPLGFFTHIEFQKIINSELDAMFKIGEEFSAWDILFVRAGFFYSKIRLGTNNNFQSELSAGAGLNIPIHKLLQTKNAFELKIDYVSRDLDDHGRFDWDNDTFQTLAVSVNYMP